MNISGIEESSFTEFFYPLAAYYDAGHIHFFLYNGDLRPLSIDKVWLNHNPEKKSSLSLPAQSTPNTIEPGMVGEVTVSRVSSVAEPRKVSYPVLDGFNADFTLPKSPLPLTIKNVTFTSDPRVFTVSCRNVSSQAVTVTGLEVFPIANVVAALSPAAPLRLKPGEETRITVTLKHPPAAKSYLWCAALTAHCRVAGCVMAQTR